jgi:hypothetical protein
VLISLWLSKGVLFLQDNAATHKAAITHKKLAYLHFEVLKTPACSPDLTPLDYYRFPNLFIKPKTYQLPAYIHSVEVQIFLHVEAGGMYSCHWASKIVITGIFSFKSLRLAEMGRAYSTQWR